MKQPSHADRIVKVTAYLTDEAFGYEHWRAAQFSPSTDHTRPAVLLLFQDVGQRERLLTLLTAVYEYVDRDAK
jgi:hypothetical protein